MAVKKHILVIDDEFEIREMLIDFLSFRGYDVSVASDGKAGLELFRNQNFDAAIIDVKMPVMSGIECARIIKKINPKFPIMMITGHIESFSRNEIEELEVEDLLWKPLDILEIEKILQNYFNKQP